MKNPSVKPKSVRDTVVILRCRDLDLVPGDRKELERSDAAIARVFQKIHRIEWHFKGRDQSVDAKCQLRSRTGEFGAVGSGTNARQAIQVVTEKILKQKRRAKETSLSKRRDTPKRARAV